MKKYIILGLFAGLLLISQAALSQTPQLTFRMTNPRVLFTAGVNYLQFDIEVKSSMANEFLDGTTMYFSFNTSAFSETGKTAVLGSHYNENNIDDSPKYSTSITFSTVGSSRRMNVAVSSSSGGAGQPGGTDYFSEVYTYFHILCTVRIRISNNALLSGVFFNQSQMNGVGAYKDLGSSTPQSWTDPHLYDTKDFAKLYLGRLFNSVSSWTQIGGSLNWSTSLNTSIWDSSGTLSATGALANKVKIHAHSTLSPGGRFKLAHGSQLTIADSLIIEEPEGLWLRSNDTINGGGAQLIDANKNLYTSGGSVRVERFLPQEKWHYYCLPVQSTTAMPFFNLYMKGYNEPMHAWYYIVPTTTVLDTVMKGYAMWSDESNPPMGNYTARVIGELNTGAKSIGITRTLNPSTQNYDGYNLVGNPYPSAVDLSSGSVTWNDVEQKAWFWNPVTGHYEVYLYIGSGTHNKFAPAQQGFFVHHVPTSTTPGVFGLTNATRFMDSEPFLKDQSVFPDYLMLTSHRTGTPYLDQAVVYFDENATWQYDELYDAWKMTGAPTAPQLFTVMQEDKLTVNGLNWINTEQIIPLNFSCQYSGDFDIQASYLESFREGVSVYLEDLLTEEFHNLSLNPVYAFSYLEGSPANRFLLHFMNPFVGGSEKDKDRLQVFSYEDAIYVKHLNEGNITGKLLLYDLSGRTVFTGDLFNQPLNKFKPAVTEGYYVVLIKTDQSVVHTKVYLQNAQ